MLDRESSVFKQFWIPGSVGMTFLVEDFLSRAWEIHSVGEQNQTDSRQ